MMSVIKILAEGWSDPIKLDTTFGVQFRALCEDVLRLRGGDRTAQFEAWCRIGENFRL